MSLLYRLSLALLLAAGVGLSACVVDQDDDAGETRIVPMGGPADNDDVDVNINPPDVNIDAPDDAPDVNIDADD